MVSHVTADMARDLAEQIEEMEGVSSAALGDGTAGQAEDERAGDPGGDRQSTAKGPMR